MQKYKYLLYSYIFLMVFLSISILFCSTPSKKYLGLAQYKKNAWLDNHTLSLLIYSPITHTEEPIVSRLSFACSLIDELFYQKLYELYPKLKSSKFSVKKKEFLYTTFNECVYSFIVHTSKSHHALVNKNKK